MLNFHDDRFSLLQAIKDPIRLEVYTDSKSEAGGVLYLDDGETNDYQRKKSTFVHYFYSDYKLSVMKIGDPNAFYAQASGKIVNEIVIYGVTQAPIKVLNKYVMNMPMQSEADVYFIYIEST